MKKFLRLLLFLCIACGLMLTFQDQIVRLLPTEDIAAYIGELIAGLRDGPTPPPSPGTSGTTGPGSPTLPGGPTGPGPTDPGPTGPGGGSGGEGDVHFDLGYYYSQLSENSQAIYRAIYSDSQNTGGVAISLPSDISVTRAAGESEADANQRLQTEMLLTVQPAMDALAYDHPEIDWIRMGDGDGSTFSFSSFKRPNGDGTTKISINRLTFYMVPEERDGGVAAHSAALREAIDSFPISGETRYELLASIQEELCRRVVYTLDADAAHDAAGALLDGQAVCDGYAKAFKLLCDRMGIPCIIVAGQAYQSGGGEPHAWNYVMMEDGAWYAVDATWNDKGEVAGTDFFLIGSATVTSMQHGSFSSSHRPSGVFSGAGYTPFVFPTLSTARYIYAPALPDAA